MSAVNQPRRRLLQAVAAGAALASLRGAHASCLGVPYPSPQVTAGFTHGSAAAPIGWIFSADYNTTGTCFLVAEDWIATAAHVLEDEVQAAGRVVVFNYTAEAMPGERDSYALSPYDGGYIRSDPASDLDFCLVRVTPKKGQRGPGARWGTLPLSRVRPATATDPVVLIHHPDRRVPDSARHAQHFKCASTSYVVEAGAAHCVHSACAEEGSSGAPLIGLDGRLLGIHSRKHLDETGEHTPGCWIATSAARIVDSLRTRTLTPEQAALIRRA